MHSFRYRSYQKELLDQKEIPFEDIRKNMQELEQINRTLGGHRVTKRGFATLVKTIAPARTIRVAEIGCGGGDNLRAIRSWASAHHMSLELLGIDINPEGITYASQDPRNSGIAFFVSDFRDFHFSQKPDIIFSSLFCHHFTDEEIIGMLQWMKQEASVGFFINDLHRHPLAFYSIKLLTQLFSKSYLVKNDAPVSVMRGFRRQEWINFLSAARIGTFECSWHWAFRWLITVSSYE